MPSILTSKPARPETYICSHVARAVTAALLMITAPACALVAGLEEHELAPAEPPKGPGWPDSATVFCSDGTKGGACPTSEMAPSYGQDGNYIGRVSQYTIDASGNNVTASVTGITWRRKASPMPLPQSGAAAYCAGLSSSGATYRLPTREELISLIDYGALNDKISKTAFEGVTNVDSIWTLSAYPGQGQQYWMVELRCVVLGPGMCALDGGGFEGPGVTGARYEGSLAKALCVLDEGSPKPMGPLDVPASGEVINDPRTGLMWARSTAPMGTSWLAALQYCENQPIGGYEDWRLPNIKELQTIVDGTTAKLYWDVGPNGYIWSSTPCPNLPDGAYAVLIDSGTTKVERTTLGYHDALCVRSGL